MKHLPKGPLEVRQETSPMGSWHANFYRIDRRNCVIFCHDGSRYALLLPGLIKENFLELAMLFKAVFLQSLAAEGCTEADIKKVAIALGPIVFDTHTERSVLSSLNIAHGDLEAYLHDYANVMDVDLFELSVWLNNRVTSVKSRFISPRAEMLELIDRL